MFGPGIATSRRTPEVDLSDLLAGTDRNDCFTSVNHAPCFRGNPLNALQPLTLVATRYFVTRLLPHVGGTHPVSQNCGESNSLLLARASDPIMALQRFARNCLIR
jgi:hypothetical protein